MIIYKDLLNIHIFINKLIKIEYYINFKINSTIQIKITIIDQKVKEKDIAFEIGQN